MNTFRNTLMLAGLTALWLVMLFNGVPFDWIRETLLATAPWATCTEFDDRRYCDLPRSFAFFAMNFAYGLLAYPAFQAPRPMRWVVALGVALVLIWFAVNFRRAAQPAALFDWLLQLCCVVIGGFAASRLIARMRSQFT